jgi:hypothetical protein
MAKPLSEQLSELSIHVKNTEDAVSAAQKEAHDKILARMDQARTAAMAAVDRVNTDVRAAGDSTTKNWNVLKAKVAADMDALKSAVGQRKHELDAKRAETQAESLEWAAGFAIDYAISSVEQAKLALLDAIAGRVEADEARKS